MSKPVLTVYGPIPDDWAKWSDDSKVAWLNGHADPHALTVSLGSILTGNIALYGHLQFAGESVREIRKRKATLILETVTSEGQKQDLRAVLDTGDRHARRLRASPLRSDRPPENAREVQAKDHQEGVGPRDTAGTAKVSPDEEFIASTIPTACIDFRNHHTKLLGMAGSNITALQARKRQDRTPYAKRANNVAADVLDIVEAVVVPKLGTHSVKASFPAQPETHVEQSSVLSTPSMKRGAIQRDHVSDEEQGPESITWAQLYSELQGRDDEAVQQAATAAGPSQK